MLMEPQRHRLACDFDDALEALDYWRGRRARLSWHKRAARREADAMVDAWERRVRWAALTDASLPMGQRLEAGVLVLRTRGAILGRRWRTRAFAFSAAMAAIAGFAFAAVTSLF
jgi:hypothetical protein